MTDTFEFHVLSVSSGQSDFITSEAKFGDGYSQEAEQGINAEQQKWSVVIGPYNVADMQTVIDFLRAHKGISFYWTPPFSDEGYYRMKGYKPSPLGGGMWTLSAEFYQVFGP